MRKALVVGVDYYSTVESLHGCVNDAHAVKTILERNSDGTVNFDVKLMTATGSTDQIDRRALRECVQELFRDDSEVALFYFAGHGYIDATGGYLCDSKSQDGNDGVPLNDILKFANSSRAKNKIIILDSCHSGIAGNSDSSTPVAELTEGMTILTASTAEQYASEDEGTGLFTTLLVDALSGAAGNLVGQVTPGSVYAHIDQSLGSWQQRPVFKTNVKRFVSLRSVQPPIGLSDLQKLTRLFPDPAFEFQLDPTFEPERTGKEDPTVPAPLPKNTEVFAILQNYNRVNLLVPIGAPHMWHAAMQSKRCKLTVLGAHYHRLVKDSRI
ncbi:MAG TPA: caspase family protein [Terriglobia bacterium]|nr:caspase family protein [Terriglobia bacterium]